MADVASPRREDYCAHEESTVGCIACDYINEWEYRINGLAEHEKWSAAVKQAEKFLGLEGLNNDQKQRYTNELKTAREYKKACENNLPGLDEVVDSRKAEVDAVCSKHPRESWPQAFQDLVGPKVEKLRAIMRRAFPDNPQVGVFVRESESTKQAQAQRSDEAGVKETQGSSSATTIDSAWQAIVDSHRQRPDFESEDMKQRYAILQKKLEEAVLDLDDRKLGLGSPLDYYDGEPILLIKLRELEREGNEYFLGRIHCTSHEKSEDTIYGHHDLHFEIKRKYNLSFSMFSYNGVSTESEGYDMNNGRICQHTS